MTLKCLGDYISPTVEAKHHFSDYEVEAKTFFDFFNLAYL